jgi:putative Mn2+ efflux pump MntP
MARKKSQKSHSFFGYEFTNILAGSLLILLGLLMFLSTTETSVVGGILRDIGEVFFGMYYRYISAPILVVLGSMILVKKASW